VEADAADLGQPVGVLLDQGGDVVGLSGEVLDDPRGVAGRDAGAVQEQHEFANVLV